MATGLWFGLILVGGSILLFAIALPRGGEVVWYLKGKDGVQSIYMMVLVGLFACGAILCLSSVR